MRNANLFTTSDCIPWTDEIIEGKLIIIEDKFFKEEFRDAKYQLVLAVGGFGCDKSKLGNAIYVHECYKGNAEHYRIERCNNNVLGIATEEAIAEWKKLYGEFNEEVLRLLNMLNKED